MKYQSDQLISGILSDSLVLVQHKCFVFCFNEILKIFVSSNIQTFLMFYLNENINGCSGLQPKARGPLQGLRASSNGPNKTCFSYYQ